MLFIALQVAFWGLMVIATIALGIRAYGKRQKMISKNAIIKLSPNPTAAAPGHTCSELRQGRGK